MEHGFKTPSEARCKAFAIAVGLLESMDTDAFWGEEVFDWALEDPDGRRLRMLDAARGKVLDYLSSRSLANAKGRKKRS